eukprot:CAMPEP_0117684560 /NCGR_PEP_ID=MMETSP0804-20121206/21167_1 /TAXON_ID=1074897 /ORGANISM="Tetraselmis astigmatica, Strain CCMP880" /LENGTH=394 /DNA_ID=CAMNT_0005495565 /DNA_START=515 /DNA_END=1696 /DNA_ORIENTATION=+
MQGVALGVSLVTLGGLLNGTWNLPTKDTSPRIAVAISEGWSWDHVWVVFQVLQAVLNTLVILLVVTPAVLHEVYATTSWPTMVLVCVFCLIWGFGTLGFGMAIKMLGMAVGTSSTMGVIQVVGTCLPIFMEFQSVTLKSGLLTLFSVLTGLMGFTLSALAANRKEQPGHTSAVSVQAESQCAVLPEKQGEGHPELATGSAVMVEAGSLAFALSDTVNPLVEQRPAASVRLDTVTAIACQGKADSGAQAQAKPKFWKGLLVALFGGLASSMLQFAFVYGDEMVVKAEQLGVATAAAPMVVWLLAFNLAMLPNLMVSCVRISKQGGWGGFVSVSRRQQAKSYTLCFLMAFFFMGHIHLYGAGAGVIGDLGAAIGWPILMSVTVLTSQLWSVLLHEW